MASSLRISPLPKLTIQTTTNNPRSIRPIKLLHFSFPLHSPPPIITLSHHRSRQFTSKATTENGPETTNAAESDPVTTDHDQTLSDNSELSEVGQELKRMMKERAEQEEEGKDDNFINGVVDEIGSIEWPEFNKVVGITGVVLGVIAGSSVVLLTVNAVLAEISDKVFVGKGIQDFFG